MSHDVNPLQGMNKEGTIEDLGKAWGERTPQRWTFGTPARTRFVEALKRLHQSLENLQGDLRERATLEGRPLETVPTVTIAGLPELIESLCHSWAGELNRDTLNLIEGVRAARSQVNVATVLDNVPGVRA